MANTPDFDDAIDLLEAESLQSAVALTCTEKAPEDCHRALFVSHQLRRRGPGVGNIWVDQPDPQSHPGLLERLMRRHRVDDSDLAVDLQSSRAAYRRRTWIRSQGRPSTSPSHHPRQPRFRPRSFRPTAASVGTR